MILNFFFRVEANFESLILILPIPEVRIHDHSEPRLLDCKLQYLRNSTLVLGSLESLLALSVAPKSNAKIFFRRKTMMPLIFGPERNR